MTGTTSGMRPFLSHWMPVGVMLLTLCPLLAACQETPTTDEMTSVTVYGYNHRDAELAFTVVGGGSGVISANGQSGGSCCLAVPLQWRPGIEIEVRWSPDLKQWDSQAVTVPHYDPINATSLTVHFLRDGSLKAFVTKYSLGHPEHPLQGTEAELTPGKAPGAPWWRDPPATVDKESN